MSLPDPTVSVVIPCYNGARFLRGTLESALGQTRAPLEVIVVDDGSTDDSAAIAESFGPPVRVIRQANQGESVARNVGVRAARGEYVQFLDADDLLAPDAIEQKVRALDGVPGGVAVSGWSWFHDDPRRPSRTALPKADRFFPYLIGGNLGPPHCWLAPKSVIERAGGFCGAMRWFEDWDLWCRVGLLDPPLVPVAHAGALYRQHPGSQLATTRPADRARGHAVLTERLAGGMLARPELLGRHGTELFWACWTALQRARDAGVPWGEVRGLARRLAEVARDGPEELRRSRFGRLVRFLGPRWSLRLRRWLVKTEPNPGSPLPACAAPTGT